MTRHLPIIAVMMLFPAAGMAAGDRNGDVLLHTVEDMLSPTGSTVRRYFTSGPSLQPWRDSLSVSGAAASFDIDRQPQPTEAQNGTGHNLYSLEAQSYYKLSQLSTVWGRASFTAGVTRSVRYADCIDYDLLAPYVLGDDTGGDIARQRYSFGGGWARRYGVWSIGIEADYRAETASRSHDPRVRDIVSDLSVSVGGSRLVGSRYLLAADATLRTYRQDVDIDFLNPSNTIMTRPYTGMGNVYKRFDNNQCTSNGHNLTALGGGITLTPDSHGGGLRARAAYSHIRVSMVLRDFSNITMATTVTGVTEASVAWYRPGGDGPAFLPEIAARYSSRSGTENLFGTAQGSGYPTVGRRDNYSLQRLDATVRMPIEWRTATEGRLRLTATPAVTGMVREERLREPATKRTDRYYIATLGLDASLSRPGGGLMRAKVNGGSGNSATAVTAGAGYSRDFSGKIVGIEASYAHTHYHNRCNRNAATITLSIIF